jgi:hypothetical protein
MKMRTTLIALGFVLLLMTIQMQQIARALGNTTLPLASSYSIVQAATQNITLTNQGVITACQDHKNTLINASKFPEMFSDPLYTKELNYYNLQCAIMAGALK